MHFGQFLFFIIFNLVVIVGLNRWQILQFEKRFRHVKKEVQELEDLVVAIIEEFEEAATENPSSSIPKESFVTDDSSQSHIAETPVFPKEEAVQEEKPPAFHAMESTVKDPKHQKILELSGQGRSVPEIARELQMGQGEIRLILGLYQRR